MTVCSLVDERRLAVLGVGGVCHWCGCPLRCRGPGLPLGRGAEDDGCCCAGKGDSRRVDAGGWATRGVDANGRSGDPGVLGAGDGLGLGVHGRSGELGLGVTGRL